MIDCFFVFFFVFASRRRHTRYWRDWSSDVCSSDLRGFRVVRMLVASCSRSGDGGSTTLRNYIICRRSLTRLLLTCSPRSEERRVGKSVDLGGRRIIKKKKKNEPNTTRHRRDIN